jgi:hypothetical protein
MSGLFEQRCQGGRSSAAEGESIDGPYQEVRHGILVAFVACRGTNEQQVCCSLLDAQSHTWKAQQLTL